jgi:hypothetical protein
LTSEKNLRTITELLGLLVKFRSTSEGKTFLANRKNLFVEWLTNIQKKVTQEFI